MSSATTGPDRPSAAAEVAAALHDGKRHLLLAASGSVATIKLPLIAAAFSRVPNLSIRIILTPSAAQFLQGQAAEQPAVDSAALRGLPNVDAIYVGEADEWNPPWTRGAPILHIELRRWADLLVVAPLSANLLAKIANGLCDTLLTSVIRAWETDPALGKRILVAPSMNTAMWNHPLTARQLATLRDTWGVKPPKVATTDEDGERDAEEAEPTGWYEVLLPQSKGLACGDVGQGAMADWRDIVLVIRDRLSLSAEYFAEVS
ncbi:phosphopantothenoylcysteine decarboxylase [Sporothrix schenckii 1099-18]|uniref:Phosphopantothenoylcysteine decarboxylase n=1 Tax=Sporothrix schenckii 1099-18 TaxID=1397361 RepID=A0A0F2MDM1_SPOSC|nr:phosphopantothenoylcysteine decarboxylase [Sporothrix schenckii 1099-18]KJR87742.1 phosphopantothenoylcysteine decarboxylase [Sporothrix schenckii 1099-18]